MLLKSLFFLMVVGPYLVREFVHWVTSRGQPRGVRVGGKISVLIWVPAHLILLALAARAAVTMSITFLGWIGYGIYLTAILLRITAFVTLRKFYSPDVVIRPGHEVIDAGPYRYMRHPLHTALICEMSGLLIMSDVWYAAPLVLISFLAHLVRSRREEDLLEHHLGENYRIYRMKTWDALDLFPGAKK